MSLSTSALAGPILPDATPAPRGAKPGGGHAGFAQALRQQQARPGPKDLPAPRPVDPEVSEVPEAPEGGGTAAETGQATRPRDPLSPDALSTDAPAADAPVVALALTDPGWPQQRAQDRPADEATHANPAPPVAPPLPGANAGTVPLTGGAALRPHQDPPAPADTVAGAAAPRPRVADAAGARAAHGPLAAAQAAAQPAARTASDQDGQARPEAPSNASAGLLAGTGATPLPATPTSGAGAGGSAAPPSRLADAVPATPEAPPSATVEPEVGSPGFAPALGARVALLVREGVQEARLALHPADMGPITVQIALDGQAASIHFQAEQASTRSALEASLPALAAALRDGGLTLAGGGVSQQGRGGAGQRDGAAAADARAGARLGAGDGPAVEEVVVRRTPAARGVVDLYA